MQKNTFSLLESNWMFAENSKAVLFPYLIGMMKGKSIIDEVLPATTLAFQSQSGVQAIADQNSIQNDSVAILKIGLTSIAILCSKPSHVLHRPC